jgi:hypothetical protein
VLRRGDPQPVRGLDFDLPRDVGAPVRLVAWKPGRGVAVTLLLVDRAVDGLQITRIVREVLSCGRVELLRTSLPRIAKRDYVGALTMLGKGVGRPRLDHGSSPASRSRLGRVSQSA